jgi:fibronectin-binding autotransporter adhesin
MHLVTTTVVLGEGHYGDKLTVTSTGVVAPSANGMVAVYASAQTPAVSLTNDGRIAGSAGSYGYNTPGGNGGIGVDIQGIGTIRNAGQIFGGDGGYNYNGPQGGAGAAGIFITTGSVTNQGLVQGGNSVGAFAGNGNLGGDGIDTATGQITNSGAIMGGYGGFSSNGYAGNAGAGVLITGLSSVSNSGSITGGAGGVGASTGGAGGAGVILQAGGTIKNTGTIAGNIGGYAEHGGAGGVGVSLLGGGLVVNKGAILGGYGGRSRSNHNYLPGTGGAGVQLSGGSISNQGDISGGAGGYAGLALGGFGGAGVILNTGAVDNSGHIYGGAGGHDPYGTGGTGGAGVYLNGGTLTNSGTITAGAAGKGGVADGDPGDAVMFGSAVGTLVITPSSVFIGDVAANVSVDDTLVLSGKGSGTLAGLGTTVTGFTTIDEDAHAHWTLTGTITGNGALSIGEDSSLTLNGSVSIGAVGFASGGNDRLTLDAPNAFSSPLSGFGSGDSIDLAGIQATSLKYANHTLTLLDVNGTIVGALTFQGKYTQADFALQASHGGTDVIYAGTDNESWGFRDFLPQGIAQPEDAHGAYDATQAASYLAAGLGRELEGVAIVHFGHAGIPT